MEGSKSRVGIGILVGVKQNAKHIIATGRLGEGGGGDKLLPLALAKTVFV